MITHWNSIVHDLQSKKSNTPFTASPAARWASSPESDCETAVCIPAGAHLRLEGISETVQRAFAIGPVEEVVMTRLEVTGHAHRDAVRFANGKEVLLQSLNAGVTAEIDGLPPRDLTEVAAAPEAPARTRRRLDLPDAGARSRRAAEAAGGRGRSPGYRSSCHRPRRSRGLRLRLFHRRRSASWRGRPRPASGVNASFSACTSPGCTQVPPEKPKRRARSALFL